MEFLVENKLFRVDKTVVTIRKEQPFTYYTRELDGDHQGDSDEKIIQAVLEQVRAELDPTNAIVKNQEQLAKTTAALEQANQLMEGMQKVSLHNTDDIEELFARLEVLEKHNGIDHEHEDDAERHEEAPHVAETQPAEPAPVTPPVQPEPQPATEVATNGVPNVVVSEPAPAQPTTEQPVAEAPTQPAPAVEQPTESETEHEIPTPTSEASTSENNGGSNNE